MSIISNGLPHSSRLAVLVAVVLAGSTLGSIPNTHAQDRADLIVAESVRPGFAMRDLVTQYAADRGALRRRWNVAYSPARRDRFRDFYKQWLAKLDAVKSGSLGTEGGIDYALLRNELVYERFLLDREELMAQQMSDLVPFATPIIQLEESRRRLEPVAPDQSASTLAALPQTIKQTQQKILESLSQADETPSRIVALRAAGWLDDLSVTLTNWYRSYNGYDPLFSWWNEQPYEQASEALAEYRRFLQEELVGFKEGEDPPIVGDPIGAKGLRADLVHEMIPYTPAELIEIANREFAWCEEQMLKASRDLGYGDNWKAAMEYVKTLHAAPGGQPELVRELAVEVIDFIRERDMLTIPTLAEEVWRLEMMSAERQKVNPFFTGGEVISVAFPTDEMEHADKLMSMRGNNRHFARATVHHELIPGHHLQFFMTNRYNTHRSAFRTPFWIEGWALYWEMVLWDLEFPQSPEDRIGMLFWRMHRAARIIFSLNFHLGQMTPEEAIDFLVERVGHERANATGEVRRSFNGSYSPLYQAAYMLGGLQIRALHREFVDSGRMTSRAFHDAILQGGQMPIEMVRARLLDQKPPEDFVSSWRFGDQ